jgi:transglutaminase-like putative cysteine protease
VAALLDGIDLDLPPAARMAALQDRVYRHISNKNLRIGYASAGDAARLREGDCTEHALLLAALGRAAGVPTRVANGLAYTEDFGSGGPVFVPHAWVAAWTGERWQAFDAALPGDQLRLVLHADNGDPWRFYSGLDAMGNLQVESITGEP